MRYCGRQKNGKALLLTDNEIINNALEQEKSGIKPHYAFYDYKNLEKVTPAGWLVWSLSDGGCGVVYRRKDGKMIITTGLQGDFCYCQGGRNMRDLIELLKAFGLFVSRLVIGYGGLFLFFY